MDGRMYLQFWLLHKYYDTTFLTQGIYRNRMDFWQELQRVVKGLFYSVLIILSVLAMTQQAQEYSRFVLIMAFLIASILIPLQK